MPRKKQEAQTKEPPTRLRPAITPEARENQLIDLAIGQAEQQLLNGTASSQIICHFLKLATTKERLEKEIMEKQKELLEAKTNALQSAKRSEELYEKAIAAMRRYSGAGIAPDDTDIF